MTDPDRIAITLSRQEWHQVATFIDDQPIDGIDPDGVQALCHQFMLQGLFDDRAA